MPAEAHSCGRVLTALEELVGEEAVALKAGDFAAAEEIQTRAQPLVSFLAARGEQAIAAGLEPRLKSLHAARERSAAWLTSEMDRTREELRAMTGHQRMIARVAPAYGSPAGASSQISLLG